MAHNWSVNHEQDGVDYEASSELADYLPDGDSVVECLNCGAFVFDGTICEACGVPTDSWLEANPDYWDESMDGDHDSAMTSIGWGMDEDYGYYGGDE